MLATCKAAWLSSSVTPASCLKEAWDALCAVRSFYRSEDSKLWGVGVGDPPIFGFLPAASQLASRGKSHPKHNVMMSRGSDVVTLVTLHGETLVLGQNSLVSGQFYHWVLLQNQSASMWHCCHDDITSIWYHYVVCISYAPSPHPESSSPSSTGTLIQPGNPTKLWNYSKICTCKTTNAIALSWFGHGSSAPSWKWHYFSHSTEN